METGLQASAFHDFFGATAAGFAALLGLLFVAFTLRWQEIASDPRLRFTAIGSTQALVTGLMGSLCVLLPNQTPAALGWELIGLLVLFALGTVLEIRRVLRARPLPPTIWGRISTVPVVVLVGAAVAVSLISGRGPALYVQAGLYLSAFPVVIFNAWEAVWPPKSYHRTQKHH